MGQSIPLSQSPKIPIQALGTTGRMLPFLGFGVSGSLGTPLISDNQVSRLIDQAITQGISVFDTAPFYGNGLAETRLGNTLRSSTDQNTKSRPFVITKGGTFGAGKKIWKDFSIEGLTQQLAESRERLPHIDAFFLHGPSKQDLSPQLLSHLEKLRDDGWFTYLGVAGRSTELDHAIAIDNVDLIMAPIHKNLPASDLERIEKARISNKGTIGIEVLSPTAKGIRISLKPTDIWYSARAIMRGKALLSPQTSADDCFQWIRRSGLADVILSTTTNKHHLGSNISSCSQELEILPLSP